MFSKAVRSALRSPHLTALASARFPLGYFIQKDVVGFVFHAVTDEPSEFHRDHDLYSTIANFDQQVQAIKSIFNIISPDQFLSGDFEKPAALITFDDGARCYFENAIPILSRHNAPSLHFINLAPAMGEVWWSGFIAYLIKKEPKIAEYFSSRKLGSLDATEDHLSEIAPGIRSDLAVVARAKAYYGAFASLDDLKHHSINPLVFYGNHLFDHYNAVTLSDEVLVNQYNKNDRLLRQFANARPYFSYPYGQAMQCYDNRTNQVIKAQGATLIFSANALDYYGSGDVIHRIGLLDQLTTPAQVLGWVNLRYLVDRKRASSRQYKDRS